MVKQNNLCVVRVFYHFFQVLRLRGGGMKKDARKMVFLFTGFSFLALMLSAESSTIKPECQDSCGSVQIPYPFGIGPGCSLNEGFAVSCNKSGNDPAPKPFLTSVNMEILEILANQSSFRVNYPVVFSNCEKKNNSETVMDLVGTPFSISDQENQFIAMGCDNLALLTDQNIIYGGCLSLCLGFDGLDSSTKTGRNLSSCNGINCCQNSIPPYLNKYKVSMRSTDAMRGGIFSKCRYSFIAEKAWFKTSNVDPFVDNTDFVPAILLWGLNWGLNWGLGGCTSGENATMVCRGNVRCSFVDGLDGTVCMCEAGYEGNPYLPRGCREINYCSQESNPCVQSRRICLSTPSGPSCISSCPDHYTFADNNCYPPGQQHGVIIIGCSGGFGGICLVIFSWWLYRLLQRRRMKKQKEMFFKRNGGLLLQQLSATETGFEKSRIFSAEELIKATDQYNENRILGKGGQGTVFKGMMTDGRIVAVKKSKIENNSLLEQFINEVVILSQINHRNVVKLIGFCLESEIPLLVYEFIQNGTLFQHLHEPNEDFPFTWNMRLRIAVEIASALSYLHSAASIPIYHRDIKSTNILLDEKYVAKVSDFGASKSFAVDQTHMTTKVQGTFGYLDPEYFQSNQFTEKSDVYSFGVVLTELLTGQKPISWTRPEEEKNLTAMFLRLMKEERLKEILDPRISKDGKEEEMLSVGKLAKRCLNLNGKKRPTMKEVAVELEMIRCQIAVVEREENCDWIEDEDEYGVVEIARDAASKETWTTSVSAHSDSQPLMISV